MSRRVTISTPTSKGNIQKSFMTTADTPIARTQNISSMFPNLRQLTWQYLVEDSGDTTNVKDEPVPLNDLECMIINARVAKIKFT